MARPVVPDTGVFIATIRGGGRDPFAEVRNGRVWLSTVVLAELYAGTRTPHEANALELAAESAARSNHLLVPDFDDWTIAGRLISRRARSTGAMRPRDHMADILIMLGAARIKGEILTANLEHMRAWAEWARRSGMDVQVRAA